MIQRSTLVTLLALCGIFVSVSPVISSNWNEVGREIGRTCGGTNQFTIVDYCDRRKSFISLEDNSNGKETCCSIFEDLTCYWDMSMYYCPSIYPEVNRKLIGLARSISNTTCNNITWESWQDECEGNTDDSDALLGEAITDQCYELASKCYKNKRVTPDHGPMNAIDCCQVYPTFQCFKQAFLTDTCQNTATGGYGVKVVTSWMARYRIMFIPLCVDSYNIREQDIETQCKRSGSLPLAQANQFVIGTFLLIPTWWWLRSIHSG